LEELLSANGAAVDTMIGHLPEAHRNRWVFGEPPSI
jgi:hypothetical protein